MSNISYSAYLSELYNLRNMITGQALNIQEINEKIFELGNNTPSGITFIDNWEQGIDEHNSAYSAAVVYQKVSELISKIEEMEDIEQVINDHTALLQQLQKDVTEIKLELINSVSPNITEINEKCDKLLKLVEKNVMETTETKLILTDSVIPHLTTIDTKIDQILSQIYQNKNEVSTLKKNLTELSERMTK